MSVRGEGRPVTREEVEEKLVALLLGELTREAAADWAGAIVRSDRPDVPDLAVWRAIVALSGVDLISTDRPYLHGQDDIRKWLDDLRESKSSAR